MKYPYPMPRIMIALIISLCFTACKGQSPSSLSEFQSQEQSSEASTQQKAQQQLADAAILGIASPQLWLVNNPITVKVPVKQKSDHNLVVELSGEVTVQDDSVLVRTLWFQTSGPKATFIDAQNPVTRILLPPVARPTPLTFRLAAANQYGVVNSAETLVWVFPTGPQPMEIIPLGLNDNADELLFEVQLGSAHAGDISLSYSMQALTDFAALEFDTSGTLVVPAGVTRFPFSLPINLLEPTTQTDLLKIALDGDATGTTLKAQAVSTINAYPYINDPVSPAPALLGASEQPQDALLGTAGAVRAQLQWYGGESLQLSITDPCSNVIDQVSNAASCEGNEGQFEQILSTTGGLNTQNIAWDESAPAGRYIPAVAFPEGSETDYTLRLFFADHSREYSGTIQQGEVIYFDALMLTETYSKTSPPRLFGQVVDALTGAGIPEAQIQVVEVEGPVIADITTDDQGTYEVIIPSSANFLAVTIYAEGYASYQLTLDAPQSSSSERRFALSPILSGEAARIILEWGATPADLDSHFTNLSNSTQHISYNNTQVAGLGALDIDDTSAFGPETITIQALGDSRYLYYVLDYSNKSQTGSEALANSGATVTLLNGDGSQQTFQVPQQAGVIWKVFEIDGATNTIEVINQVTELEELSDPANNSET